MEEQQMIKKTKFGWVDLSDLPKTKTGNIDWVKSVGHTINFQYLFWN